MAVRVEKDGAVWTVIHSRPEARNAMDPASAVALYDAFRAFDADAGAAVAVFWGEGGAFCAGWDLKHAAALSGADALDRFDFPETGEPPMAAMGPSRLQLSKPVIAAIAGPAVAGGMELAIWADIRVMEETAFMGVYCRRWGIPLIDGGTVRLPRLVGEGRALDLILTGRRVDAAEALRIGLCEYVVPEGQARARAIIVLLTNDESSRRSPTPCRSTSAPTSVVANLAGLMPAASSSYLRTPCVRSGSARSRRPPRHSLGGTSLASTAGVIRGRPRFRSK